MDPDRTIEHITLNTGHRRASPRGEVHMDLPQFLTWVRAGPLPFPTGQEYRVLLSFIPGNRFVTGTLLSVPASRPQVTIFVCWDEGHWLGAWGGAVDAMRAVAAQFPDLPGLAGATPAPPTGVPWLGVVIWPTVDAGLVEYLGDFERCLAWALIEEDERARAHLN